MSVLHRLAMCTSPPAREVIEEAKLEAAEFNKTYEWYPQRMGARTSPCRGQLGVIDDPNVRQELMKLRSFHRA